MKTITTTFISLILAISLISCEQTTDDRIRKEFKTYVKENFGNPGEFKGITSVKLADTISYKQLDDILEKARIVDLGIEIISAEFTSSYESGRFLKIYKKASYDEQRDMMRKLKESTRVTKENESEYAELIGEIDSMKINRDSVISVHYEIKARIKKDGEYSVKVYHAYIDNQGNISVKDDELSIDEMPKDYKDNFEILDRFLVVAKKIHDSNMDFINAMKLYE